MTAAVDREYAARWDVDSARGFADTVCCLESRLDDQLLKATKSVSTAHISPGDAPGSDAVTFSSMERPRWSETMRYVTPPRTM